MKKSILVLYLVCISLTSAFAQLEKPVSWSFRATKTSKTEAVLYLKAKIGEKWHIYSLNTNGSPSATKFAFTPSKDFTLVGKTIEPTPIVKYEKALKMNLSYFEKEVVFKQKVKLKKGQTVIKGIIEFTACNDKSCLPPDEFAFSISVK